MQNEFENVNVARPPFKTCSRVAANGLYVELVSLITRLRIQEVLDSIISLPHRYQDKELPPKCYLLLSLAGCVKIY